jgi:lipopolysaccharide transport system ATP-binding protein
MEPIIKVENLSKQYRIGRRQAPYETLRDNIMGALYAPLQRLRSAFQRSNDHNVIWALKDISFEVSPGEVVGIIGRNGAGKSTLLKVLSRVTEPTAGCVEIYGRVGSLLEVGTGFHPELTGRENIYLNGAILGMKKREIENKFDEIVTFAEVEKFIDTPVKHYSSGMYLRLAFAVAAHLDPEILLVDEVLAVGDAAFQKKCLGKMGDVAKEGRTVLFVSHNMAAIESFCDRCLLFVRGRLESAGNPSNVVAQYLTSDLGPNSGRSDLSFHPGRTSHSLPIMTEVAAFSDLDVPISSFRMGNPLSVQVRFFNGPKPMQPVLGIVFKSAQGMPLFGVNNRFVGGYRFSEAVSKGTMTCDFEKLPLMPGLYFLDLYFGDQHQDYDIIHEAISIEVLPADVFGTGQLPPSAAGPIFWAAKWALQDAGGR